MILRHRLVNGIFNTALRRWVALNAAEEADLGLSPDETAQTLAAVITARVYRLTNHR